MHYVNPTIIIGWLSSCTSVTSKVFMPIITMENDASQESTYEPLEGRRRIESSDSLDVEDPPQDRNGILYIALLAAGIGFVLPYNR